MISNKELNHTEFVPETAGDLIDLASACFGNNPYRGHFVHAPNFIDTGNGSVKRAFLKRYESLPRDQPLEEKEKATWTGYK